MAMKSSLAIKEEILSKGYRFVLTSRYTQDCLGNTFSLVRSKNHVPAPVELHHALRIISVGQFFTTTKSGSYLEDNSDFLANFLDREEANVTPSIRVEQKGQHLTGPIQKNTYFTILPTIFSTKSLCSPTSVKTAKQQLNRMRMIPAH